MAPWQVAVCIINPKSNPEVVTQAIALYDELRQRGIDAVLDDRGLRPGPMLSDIELIGIPHRVVVSERGMASGIFEYRARNSDANESLNKAELLSRIGIC
jgi:prolyl-tRNA synthetase